MAQQLETGVIHQVENVLAGTGKEVVHAQYIVALAQQALTKM